MDFKSILTAPVKGAGALLKSLGGDEEQSAAKAEAMRLIGEQAAAQAAQIAPTSGSKPFELPGLDDSLSEAGMRRKEELESMGELFEPTEDDYKDAGPYGYLHKKAIHDALMEYEKEIEANRPNIDYQGILQQRLADIGNAPEPHRTNPLYLFAMAMGNPEEARELIQEHNKAETESNAAQAQRWRELLDLKQQALEGSIKQALAEGDHRKVISSKWLETLAQIEQDKAKLGGEMAKLTERNVAAERRAELRGKWAVRAAEARASAMLNATGIRENSLEWRNYQDNVRSMTQSLIRKGVEPEDAFDQAEEWLSGQLDGRTPTVSPQGGGSTGGGAASVAPQGSTNPMEEQIRKNRAKSAQ